jgi:DNA ligase (NAD+)
LLTRAFAHGDCDAVPATRNVDSMASTKIHEAKIEALGGKAAPDVTRKTSYAVVGADPGSKLAKAEKLGTTTLSQAEFLNLLDRAEGKS